MKNDNTKSTDQILKEIGERLSEYNYFLTGNNNKSDFARLIWGMDVSKSKINIISEICNGSKWFRPEILYDICIAFPKLNLNWLFTGVGDMQIENKSEKTIIEFSQNQMNLLAEEIANRINKNGVSIEKHNIKGGNNV